MDGEAHDDEKRDDEVAVDLDMQEMAEDGEQTSRDRDIMEQCQQRDPAVLPRADRARCFTERVRDIERDADDDEYERDQESLRTDAPTDGLIDWKLSS